MRQARELYSKGDAYALAMYCGGLAVECLLRAFRWTDETGFEGRHDLNALLKDSGILRVNDEFLRGRGRNENDILSSSREFRVAMNEIVALWNNNLRFASEACLAAYLKRIKRTQGIKGNPLKKNALDLINAAEYILHKGMVLWQSRTKS